MNILEEAPFLGLILHSHFGFFAFCHVYFSCYVSNGEMATVWHVCKHANNYFVSIMG